MHRNACREKNNAMKVLVTNAKNRIAYNIVRSLAAKKIDVYCADFVPRAMSFYSRYTAGHFIYPSPFSDQDGFIKCLISNIKKLNIDAIVPVFEELFLVSKHKTELLKYVKMAVPDYFQILIAHNKDRWLSIAEKLQIPVPKTFSIEGLDANQAVMDDFSFPALIKPKQGGGGWGLKQVKSASEIRDCMSLDAYEGQPWERFILQEWIEGKTLCVAMVFNHGQLRGKVSYQQIREYPFFSGQATCRISISNKAAEDNLQKLLEHLAWHGVCQADFIIENETQIPYLIDINPRFWGSLTQGIASGVDFPYLVYQIALNGDVDPVDGFSEGVVTRWLGGELRGFFQNYSRAKKKPQFLRDFFPFGNSVQLYDDFSFKDPAPFLAWGLDAIYRILRFKQLKTHESLKGVWK